MTIHMYMYCTSFDAVYEIYVTIIYDLRVHYYHELSAATHRSEPTDSSSPHCIFDPMGRLSPTLGHTPQPPPPQLRPAPMSKPPTLYAILHEFYCTLEADCIDDKIINNNNNNVTVWSW